MNVNNEIPKNGESISVYGIWIAEIMLQQTQLKVVLPYWERWMKVFPTLLDLVNATQKDVLMIWQGLGYYSRANRMHKTAKILFNAKQLGQNGDEFIWPRDVESWIKLPGIGRSTAGSIVSSAFDLPAPLLDGNVKRIFTRLLASEIHPNKNAKKLWDLSSQLLDDQSPRKFNQALMDLGATISLPKKPNCLICPINHYCSAYISFDPKNFPVKPVVKTLPQESIGIGIVFNQHNQVLIAQRLFGKSMGGMWEFPGGKQKENELITTTISREIKEETSIDVFVKKKLIEIDHSYTHKKLHFVVYICDHTGGTAKPLESQETLWVSPNDLNQYPFPSANKFMIEALIQYINK